MHTETRFVKCTFVGAKEEVDVFCVRGTCGKTWRAEVGTNQVRKSPRLAHIGFEESCPIYIVCCTSKGSEKRQGKRAAKLAPNPNSTTGSIGIIPPSEGEDSAASFQGPDVLATEQRVRSVRKPKLMCIPIVDIDIEHQLLAHGSSSSNSSSSSSNISSSSSSSSSSDNSSEGPSGANSHNGRQDVSSGSTVSANDWDSSSSSGSNTETPSRSIKVSPCGCTYWKGGCGCGRHVQ